MPQLSTMAQSTTNKAQSKMTQVSTKNAHSPTMVQSTIIAKSLTLKVVHSPTMVKSPTPTMAKFLIMPHSPTTTVG